MWDQWFPLLSVSLQCASTETENTADMHLFSKYFIYNRVGTSSQCYQSFQKSFWNSSVKRCMSEPKSFQCWSYTPSLKVPCGGYDAMGYFCMNESLFCLSRASQRGHTCVHVRVTDYKVRQWWSLHQWSKGGGNIICSNTPTKVNTDVNNTELKIMFYNGGHALSTRSHSQLIKYSPSNVSFACAGLYGEVSNNKYTTSR